MINPKILYLSIVLAFIIGLSLTSAQGISPFVEIGNLEMEVLDAINDVIISLNAEIIRISSLNSTQISEQSEQDIVQSNISTLQGNVTTQASDITQLKLDLVAAIANATVLKNRINFIEPLHVSSQAAELVSCWTGDGDATDFTGSNNGTIIDTVLFPTGQVGQAFDTRNGYILVPDSDDLNMVNGVTLAAWVNPQSQLRPTSIIQKWENSNPLRSDYRMTSETGFLPTTHLLGSSIGFVDAANNRITEVTINSWTHIAITYDGIEGKNKFYKNGVLVDERLVREDFRMNNSTGIDVLIGNNDNINQEPFQGFIDEPAIFNHALTDQQISDVFAAGASCSDYVGL